MAADADWIEGVWCMVCYDRCLARASRERRPAGRLGVGGVGWNSRLLVLLVLLLFTERCNPELAQWIGVSTLYGVELSSNPEGDNCLFLFIFICGNVKSS